MGLWTTHGRNRVALSLVLPLVVLLALAARSPHWSFRIRSLLLAAPFVAATYITYWTTGFAGNSSLIAATGVVLVGLLLGRRWMLAVLGILLLAPLGAAAAMVSGALPPDLSDVDLRLFAPWLRTTTVGLAGWTILGLVVTFVVQRIERALGATNAALTRLKNEQALREHAEAARRETERSALQAQKMELVGRVAAGVAHDVNNLLSVVSNWGELLADKTVTEEERAEASAALESAVQHGSALTRRLLALARRDSRSVTVFRLDDTIRTCVDMLRRLLPANMELVFQSSESVQVEADETEVQQVIFNLVINARDAMPAGGVIAVSSGTEVIDEPRTVAGGKLEPGRWAFLRVRDAGTGIEPAIRERLFDLFFTTKPLGEGTGLGLAMVMRIAQQAAGGVVVESEPGAGATFTVYLERREPGSLSAT